MALLLDETFASGIPGGFASVVSDSGTLTATYNAGQQAVDLVKDGFNALWHIQAFAPAWPLRVVLDLEHVADGTGSSASGWGFALRLASESWWHMGNLSVESAQIFRARGIASQPAAFVEGEGASVPYSGQGSRHTYVLAFDADVPGRPDWRRARILRDGAQIYVQYLGGLQGGTLDAFGIFLRDTSVRLHSIQAYDDLAGLPALPDSASSLPAPVRVFEKPPVRPVAPRLFGASVFVRDWHVGGPGRIVGTVKEAATPTDLPLRRKVRLYEEFTGRWLREAWSDPVTGAYAFEGLAVDRRYTVISYDHTQLHRAVIADNLLPEV